jgi:hypothetical protein
MYLNDLLCSVAAHRMPEVTAACFAPPPKKIFVLTACREVLMHCTAVMLVYGYN